MLIRCIFLCLLLPALTSYASNPHSAEFVGSEACQSCHQAEFKQWQNSHHKQAMQHANDDSVLGDFSGKAIEMHGQKVNFYKKDKQFFAAFTEKNQPLAHYKIKYTFGYYPLQQYMVEFDDGRVQLIPYAWDSRPKQAGGQRWFNLYPNFGPKDEFYWKNVGQNWNYMCADCHSTNVKKNYDVDTNTYNTSYNEITVGCEACHGPASDHIEWAKKPDSNALKGFQLQLHKAVTQWHEVDGNNTLQPKETVETDQMMVCAQCHSRRMQISEQPMADIGHFGERYMLSQITGDLYYPDGQIYEEVYVYGSYLQSKMAAKGVSCTNCHNPHTAELAIPVEAVCQQCHDATAYNQENHSRHDPTLPGGQCVDCHMPETTYMEVDDRRDHFWHKPNPQISKSSNSPDVCLSCHEDKDSSWSIKQTKLWFNQTLNNKPFAPVFAIHDSGLQPMGDQLAHIAQNYKHNDITRAAALTRIGDTQPNQNTVIAAARGAKHKSAQIRLAAIEASSNLPPQDQWRIISPLLTDKVKAVRIEAASNLSQHWQSLSFEQQNKLAKALDEYQAFLAFNFDRAYAHVNMANVYVNQGQYDKAEQAYKQAMTLEPYFSNAYQNYAELHRLQGNEKAAIDTLKQGIKQVKENASLHYSLGLAYVRNKNMPLAAQSLLKAAESAKTNPQYYYVYALSIENTDMRKAQQALFKAYEMSQQAQYLYTLCEFKLKAKDGDAEACLNSLASYVDAAVINNLRMRYK
ncbi:tetratricopeptide repeat protein [Thalassotalea agarivorans]|uniref:Tetratricopeptide repeat-containing protein n=1 Tax=Thalassotalea agarivorans TaxID=349064 RepID=A0A1I0ESH3_THASX|nr:cytochrome c3 family protein [Thalassotalea agarivorans]SET48326.1 Tetratricopeptide repeat-containing protein [Thalassotalea agarivorans]